PLPQSGSVLISVNDYDKGAAAKIARDLHNLGFKLFGTAGTARWLAMVGLPVETINKVADGSPHVVDAIRAGQLNLIINTPLGGQAHEDGAVIRSAANVYGVPLITTLSAAMAAVQG